MDRGFNYVIIHIQLKTKKKIILVVPLNCITIVNTIDV